MSWSRYPACTQRRQNAGRWCWRIVTTRPPWRSRDQRVRAANRRPRRAAPCPSGPGIHSCDRKLSVPELHSGPPQRAPRMGGPLTSRRITRFYSCPVSAPLKQYLVIRISRALAVGPQDSQRIIKLITTCRGVLSGDRQRPVAGGRPGLGLGGWMPSAERVLSASDGAVRSIAPRPERGGHAPCACPPSRCSARPWMELSQRSHGG